MSLVCATCRLKWPCGCGMERALLVPQEYASTPPLTPSDLSDSDLEAALRAACEDLEQLRLAVNHCQMRIATLRHEREVRGLQHNPQLRRTE